MAVAAAGPNCNKADFKKLDSTEITIPSLKTFDLIDDIIEDQMRKDWVEEELEKHKEICRRSGRGEGGDDEVGGEDY